MVNFSGDEGIGMGIVRETREEAYSEKILDREIGIDLTNKENGFRNGDVGIGPYNPARDGGQDE